MTDMNDGDKQARALLYYATKERWSHAKRGHNVVSCPLRNTGGRSYTQSSGPKSENIHQEIPFSSLRFVMRNTFLFSFTIFSHTIWSRK